MATSTVCLIAAPRMLAQAAPAGSETDQEAVLLSPFVVEASEDSEGYSAKATLAGTRVRTELKDVGSAISVITPKFLQDTNSRNSADLLVYTTGTEVAGQGGNFTGAGDAAVLDTTAYTRPVANTRVRGLAEADNVRDFFLTDIPWDSYNVGRVDLQRGPNSILFGIGSPAGIINSSTNSAAFKDSNKVDVQVSSFGSYRGSLDLNKVILKDQLAIRFAALRDDTKYKQEPAYRDDHRIYGAVRFDPQIFNKGSAHTSFRANFEQGTVHANYPRLTPPMDAITPWFTSMNKLTHTYQDISNITNNTRPDFSPWVGSAGNRIYDGVISIFDNQDASEQSRMIGADVKNVPATTDSSANNTINGSWRGIVLYNSYAQNVRTPGYAIQPFKAKSLTDASIFDFYNNLIEGDNKKNFNRFKAYNLNLSQTFLDNKIGFELAYDNQWSQWGWRNFISGDAAAITVDIMNTYVDGTPNPNVGRAYIVGGGGSAGQGMQENRRESLRGTATAELNFGDVLDRKDTLTEILGRHVFTYSGAKQQLDARQLSTVNWYTTGFAPTDGNSVSQASRDDTTITYLSGDLRSVGSPAGLHLGRINAIQAPTGGTIQQWNTTKRAIDNYTVGIKNTGDISVDDLSRDYTQARKFRDIINSDTFVWQGYFFGGNIVPMIGWRRDIAENFDAGNPAKDRGVVTNLNDPEWRLPTGQLENATGANGERIYNIVSGQTHTWSIVAHVPQGWLRHVPGGWGARVFYNESQNFQPDASRLDLEGGHIPSPTGETKDYGVAISALNDKIMLKVNRYETRVNNATLNGGGIGNIYLIGAGEAWGQQAAINYRNAINANTVGTGQAGTVYGTIQSGTYAGKVVHWEPHASEHVNPNDFSVVDPASGSVYTQAGLIRVYQEELAAVDDWFKHQVSEGFQRAWGMSDYGKAATVTSPTVDPGSSWSQNTVAVTGDTLSKGTEYELIASPLPGLDISFNASKTDARRLNIGKAYSDYLDQRIKDYAGPMGDMRIWGGGNWFEDAKTDGTTRYKFNNEVLGNYKLALALNNSTVPELRPWRFNVTANYAFRDGLFKGANVGGSYRWQDRQVVGFQLNDTLDGYDVNKRWYGPTEDAFDFWIGYGRKLTTRINWRIQLNVRDLFASKTLIPITVQPDGSPGTYRIPEPRVIMISNTFEF